MKRLYLLLLFLAIVISNPGFAQVGCPGNYSTVIIKGADSTDTHGDQTFRSLIVNPKNPNVAYIGTEGNGIFKTVDGGVNWHWYRAGIKQSGGYAETYSMAINPEDTSELFLSCTAGPGHGQNTAAGIYVSHNGGQSWEQRNCGIPNSSVSLIWYDEVHPDTVFASTSGGYASTTGPLTFYPGGIYRSIDKGLNWLPVTMPSNADTTGSARVVIRGKDMLVFRVAGTPNIARGFLKSSDYGATWSYLPKPLSNKYIVEYDATPGLNSIYAIPRDSMVNYHSTDTGKTWSRNSFEMNGLISIYPGASDTMFFDHGGDLIRCTNKLNSVFPGPDYQIVLSTGKFIEKLVYAPSNPRIIYVSTRGYKVYKSIDGGHTFTLMVRLRDIIEQFTTPPVDIKIVYRETCPGGLTMLSVVNNHPAMPILNYEWMGDGGALHSLEDTVYWVFTTNGGVGEFPVSVHVTDENQNTGTFYDTLTIYPPHVVLSDTVLTRNDTLFVDIQHMSPPFFVTWRDPNTGAPYYNSNSPYLPMSAIPSLSGEVTLQLDIGGSGGCFYQEDVHFEILNTSTGVRNEESKSIRVWPNPVSDHLFIQGAEEIRHVSVYDLHGRLIEGISVADKSITLNVGDYEKGYYLMKVLMRNGEIHNHKVVID